MPAIFQRPPILAAVGLLAVALARTPRSTPAVVLDLPVGCPVTPVAVPVPVLAPAHLIYISGPDLTNDSPPDHEPLLR
jgi:hypothetical protein